MDLACSEDGETELLQKWLLKPTWGGQNCLKIVFKSEVLNLRVLLQGSYSHGVRGGLGYYTAGNYSWGGEVILQYVCGVEKNEIIKWRSERLCRRGFQVGAMHPLQIWMHPLGIYKISKTNILISPLKNVRHPTASSCYLWWTAAVGNNSLSDTYV
jgi:hypothetical protein